MLELPNFGYMTTSTMQFESPDKILVVTAWVEIFVDIIKIATMFLKQSLKTQKS